MAFSLPFSLLSPPSGPAAKVELELLEDVEDLPDGQLRRHHWLRGVARGLLNVLEECNYI